MQLLFQVQVDQINFYVYPLKDLLNFFVITKSTLRRFKLSIFCSKLDILKFLKALLKKNFGIGSKVKTQTFKEYFFLYFFANENNF